MSTYVASGKEEQQETVDSIVAEVEAKSEEFASEIIRFSDVTLESPAEAISADTVASLTGFDITQLSYIQLGMVESGAIEVADKDYASGSSHVASPVGQLSSSSIPEPIVDDPPEGEDDKLSDRREQETSEVTTTDSIASPSPLSWEEARLTLTQVLDEYMASPTKTMLPRAKNTPSSCSAPLLYRFRDWWFTHDMDMYLGSFALSVGLLIISVFSLVQSREPSSVLHAEAGIKVYRSQLAASIMLLCGSGLSIALTRKRRQTSMHDGDVVLRRTIAVFLSKLNEMTLRKKNQQQDDQKSIAPKNDIYPTYRRYSESKDSSGGRTGGEWHLIPTLLLVKGDYIALQVGDIAPGDCELLSSVPPVPQKKKSKKMHDGKESNLPRRPDTIRAGERITSDYFGLETHRSFPLGPSGVPIDSPKLLNLCNNMRIFVLIHTQVEVFLQERQAQKRPPQIYRQAASVRVALQAFSVFCFVGTIVIICVRPSLGSTDLSLLLPLPFLAALAVLPVSMPVCLFFLEVLGTSRILVAAHPYASNQRCLIKSPMASPSTERLLFLRYCVATIISRISLGTSASFVDPLRKFSCHRVVGHGNDSSKVSEPSDLLQIPPATAYILEKLGVATALALVDDELACDPFSTPQQLLIPSANGLKLLDLCPAILDEEEDDSVSENRVRSRSFESSHDSDSDSDDEQKYQHSSKPRRTLQALRRKYKRKISGIANTPRYSAPRFDSLGNGAGNDVEVQFEDPLWWQFLPSLKCIGLACLLVNGEDKGDDTKSQDDDHHVQNAVHLSSQAGRVLSAVEEVDGRADGAKMLPADSHNSSRLAESALIKHVCQERGRAQLNSLAQCIGFSTEPNAVSGKRGDLTPFVERRRLHVVATQLLSDRLAIDTHALGLEESRNWGFLRTDCTSVVVQDSRSQAYQLLTVGDARVVTELCKDSWQGQSSTISPLTAVDRQAILETSKNWSLADLDVSAFSYAPVPFTFEQRIGTGAGAGGAVEMSSNGKSVHSKTFLVDNRPRMDLPTLGQKDTSSEDWSLIKNQIFLGVLGSSVKPRGEVEVIIEICATAGVRFVYFSPRNMRRTKELASQMGIDVAWNCAISLRPLTAEEEEDPHRMTSTYADWDVNAKLPHGVEDVKHHLEEVDNVPLLVSLFTDVTKGTTAEMVGVFQEYHDTVLSIGLAHLYQNRTTFSVADLSIGIDVLSEEITSPQDMQNMTTLGDTLSLDEVAFVNSLAAHSCLFILKGSHSISNIPEIIAYSRASLEASISSALFIMHACITLSLYILFCPCSISTAIPYVPIMGSAFYILLVLPLLGLTMAMSSPDEDSMTRVPPKNDESKTFTRKEGQRLAIHSLAKAILPAAFPQVLYLVAFGSLIVENEPDLVKSYCDSATSWASVVRCDALRDYSDTARTSAGTLAFGCMVTCTIFASASFLYGNKALWNEAPWRRNRSWRNGVGISIFLLGMYLLAALERGTFAALPWYFFCLSLVLPFLCLYCCEVIKRIDRRHENRAVMLRRLQFETRLGMWSPK